MYFNESVTIAHDNPNLFEEIHSIDAYLGQRSNRVFVSETLSDILDIDEHQVIRLLREYSRLGVVIEHSVLTCPIHENSILEEDAEGNLICDLCGEDGYSADDCPQRTVFELVREPNVLLPTMLLPVEGTDVFISYSRTDRDFADNLVRVLNENDITSWFDQERIMSGDEFIDNIQEGINRCHLLLLLMSEKSLQSEWVKMEYRYAAVHKKRIVPVLLSGGGLIPPDLIGKDYVDFTSQPHQSAMRELVADLKKALSS